MARRLSPKALSATAQHAAAPFQPEGAAPPAVKPAPVTALVRHPRNARSIPPSPQATRALVASVRAAGVLMPILVCPMGDGQLGVLAGWQRALAAREVGLASVPAIEVASDDATLDRLSLVENALRSEMHPVDQWRSLDTLMQGGATFDAAAATLGLDDRAARRLRMLAQMHPKLLAEMAKGEVPGDWMLREIVRASHDRQAEALKAATVKQGKSTRIDWQTVSAGCKQTSIPRGFAIFDTRKAPVVFECDFFAEPGSKEEWTTTDLDGFRELQRAAMAELVAGHERAAVHDYRPSAWAPEVPKGWHQMRWLEPVPDKVPELADDQRFVVAMKPDAQVVGYVYRVDPEQPRSEAAAPGDAQPPRMMTDAGLQMAALMKHQALRDALEEMRDSYDNETPLVLLRALLECLSAQNVTPGAADKHAAAEAIAEATPGGGEPSPGCLVRVAAQTISDMLIFPAPKLQSSGPVADEIARSLGAAQFLPRCDTAEFLAQCSGALLREAARLVERQPGQKVPNGVGELRAFLVGKLPDWRPFDFGQEAPADV